MFYIPCGCCSIDVEEYDGPMIHCKLCDNIFCDLCFGEEACLQCESGLNDTDIIVV